MNRLVVYIYIKNLLEVFLFLLALAGIIFVGGKWFLQDYYNEVSARMVRVSNEKGQLNRRIKEANTIISQTTEIQKDYTLWTKIIVDIEKSTPEGIVFDTMVLDQEEKKYIFTGKAKSRDDLLLFEKSLKDLAYVASIDLPLSQLTEKTNVAFIITANLK